MMIANLIQSPLFLLMLTIGVYYASMLLYKRVKLAVLNPILVSMVVVIALLKLLNVPYERYYEANQILNFLLSLSVVALGYLLHDNIGHIRGRECSILCSIFIGSVTGVVSVVLLTHFMGLDQAITASLQPKSVTTPIALALSSHSGGIVALTSVSVIMVGLLGSIIGPFLLAKIGVKSSIARGLALGAGAHAVGTAKAMELGAVEGAIAGVAIGLMGVMTALVIPIVEKIVAML